MRNLRRHLVATVTLFVVASALLFAERTLGWPVDALIVAVAVLLSGSGAFVIHCTQASVEAIQTAHEQALQRQDAANDRALTRHREENNRVITAQREENERLIRRITEENTLLVQRVTAELDGYADRRVIDALVSSERQRIVNERAGLSTVDLARLGLNDKAKVTDIRKHHHRRNDAG